MKSIKISKRTVDSLPVPPPEKKTGVIYFDSELRGFGVRVYPSGKRVYIVQYGDELRRRKMTLGAHGPLTPDRARRKAQQILAGVIEGVDPLDKRQAQREDEARTFELFAAEYLRGARLRKAPRSIREDERYLKVACDAFGSKPLSAITVTDISRIVDTYAMQDKKRTANRFLASVRACLAAAWRASLIQENVAKRVRSYREQPRDTWLTVEEIKRVAEWALRLNDPFQRAGLVALVATGARPDELRTARWDQLDEESGALFVPNPKEHLAKTIVFPALALDLIRELPRVSPYLFPGRKEGRPQYQFYRKLWDRCRRELSLEGNVQYDSRRGVGKALVDREVPRLVTSEILGHLDPRTTDRFYSGRRSTKTKREALEAVAPVISIDQRRRAKK